MVNHDGTAPKECHGIRDRRGDAESNNKKHCRRWWKRAGQPCRQYYFANPQAGWCAGYDEPGNPARGECANEEDRAGHCTAVAKRSDEHTSALQSLMRISYAVFCLKKKRRRISKHEQK